MGNCVSSRLASQGADICWETRVNIVHLDGKLEQLKKKKKAGHVLSQNPNCFLCCSESMFVGSLIPQVNLSEELQLGHIYFLLPQSKSHVPLSLRDLCALAIKANAALAYSQPEHSIMKSCVPQTDWIKHPLSPQGIPTQILGL